MIISYEIFCRIVLVEKWFPFDTSMLPNVKTDINTYYQC